MNNGNKSTIIALEEHYWDRELSQHFIARGPEMRVPALQERLYDLGALRIKEMDEAGIDIQVLSHGAPALQKLDAATAVPLARKVNDNLLAAIKLHPGRLEGFAVLPSADPVAAADEQRASAEECPRRLPSTQNRNQGSPDSAPHRRHPRPPAPRLRPGDAGVPLACQQLPCGPAS